MLQRDYYTILKKSERKVKKMGHRFQVFSQSEFQSMASRTRITNSTQKIRTDNGR